MKKAQISFNMIILLILALTVLVLVLLFVTGNLSKLFSGIESASPSEEETNIKLCSIKCTQAKADPSTCLAVWNNVTLADGTKCTDTIVNCECP